MVDVFISYKKERRLHAQRLAVVLEARGYDIWWDHGLLPGDEFDEQIVEKLAAAKAVLVIWCSGAVRSGFVKSEARRAFKERKLIQAHIEDVVAPIGLDVDQCQSLVDWAGGPDHEAISKLLAPIEKLVGRPPRQSPNVIDALSAFLPALPRVEPILVLEEKERDEAELLAPQPLGGDREVVFFQACRTADDFEAYVSRFPNGDFIPIAQNRMRELDEAWIAGLGITERDLSIEDRATLVAKMGSRASRAELEPRARRGNAAANAFLGMQFVEAGDSAQAASYYALAAESGFSRAQTALGVMYSNGQGVQKDLAKAAQLHRRAAEQGNAFGQNNFAVMLQLGQGMEVDLERAQKWYLRAAEQGHPDAQCNVGILLQREGTKAEALRWFEKASASDSTRAQWLAGKIYEDGAEEIPRDFEKAAAWYKRAAERGHAWSQASYANLLMHGRGVPKNPEDAVRLFRKAAEQGNSFAQYHLAKALEHGTGVIQDMPEAVEWYGKAAELGHSAAAKAIKRISILKN